CSKIGVTDVFDSGYYDNRFDVW
nr:immunoglobulin heavy chain junction region [Macaca mulatta]MOV54470.1 immunoglobulin heavy chain junction region [Macaca mulatta]MOV57633.1 immunoglobulin heavy chain junction region [Macaca mulatta]MOV57759.1 immunoglobulin heavy chain junction region [Macaca mulatta]MOV58052.1 immunoglobulin heavy chain junction region [Macaca mulatta]